MTQNIGVFTAQDMQTAIDARYVQLGDAADLRDDIIRKPQIQPSSLDLTLGHVAYRIRASFLPGTARKIADCLTPDFVFHEIDLSNGAVLEKDCVYLVPLRESLSLPDDVYGSANPKSSTGRIDVFIRLCTDGATKFETVAKGYDGKLYAQISPKTFSIKVRTGSSLNQLRLRRGDASLDDATLNNIHTELPLSPDPQLVGVRDGLGWQHMSGPHGLGVTVDLLGQNSGITKQQDDNIIGYRARRHAGLIDVDRIGTLPWQDYWEAIPARPNIILDPNEFYILASKEWICIPPNLAAEMVPIDPLLGEFRVHYAGFFDPGFGYDATSHAQNGSRGVLEVRGHDAPFMLEDGQMVARLVFEHLASPANPLYGQDLKSNYQGQGLKLSKHFI